MTIPATIYEQFAVITASTAVKLGINIMFAWGHVLEVSGVLDQMSKMPQKSAKKYPLIALFTDIEESRGADSAIDNEVKLHLIIAVNTRTEYTSAERLTRNFKPTLYPIYDELLRQIASSGYYREGTPSKLTHTKTDRFRYGKTGIYANSAEIFKDRIDCIEIENLNLNIIKQTCKNDSNIK